VALVRGALPLPDRLRALFPAVPEWWPHSALGGQRGSIDLPSTEAVDEGFGIPAHQAPEVPYPRGQSGPIPLISRTIVDLVGIDGRGGGMGLTLGEPQGWLTSHQERGWHPNIETVAHRVPPAIADTNWSTNKTGAAECDLKPDGPIMFGLTRIQRNWNEEFDTRVQTDYVKHVRPQPSLIPQRALAGYHPPEMLYPYFPRLTVWETPGSFGQTTEVLMPTPEGQPGGVFEAPAPMANY